MNIRYLTSRSLQKVEHFFEDSLKSVSHSFFSEKKGIVNDLEIRVAGLRRSGNHAIINWIGKQCDGNRVFINCVKPNENPYRNEYESQRYLERDKRDKKHWGYGGVDWWKKEKEGDFSKKQILIYSYEDQELERIFSASYEKKHDLYVGKSKRRIDLIIIRDPFNLFSSRLHTKPRKDGRNFSMLQVYSKKYSLPELWLEYAKECLNETSHAKAEKIFVNYNDWKSSIDYRKELAERIGIKFSDKGLNDVSVSGRGSSFDGTKFSGNAEQMDVMNRWKHSVDDEHYKKLFANEEIIVYSRKIFGHIEGTEALFGEGDDLK